MRKSLVSIVALGLFAGAPAMAQTATDEAITNQAQQTQQQSQQQGTQQQGTQQQTAQQQQAPTAEQMQQMLSAYQERSEIDGFIARATDAEGNPVLVLVAPRDFKGDRDVQAQENDVRERLEQSRFNGVEMLQQPTIVRAIVDENNHIIALAATRILPAGAQTTGLTGQTGQTGQTGTQDQTAMQGQTGQTGETGELGTSGAVTGGEPRSTMSEDEGVSDTGQTGIAMGQTGTETGQTGTELGQTGTELGQTDTETGRDATVLGETDTDTTVEMGQSDTVMQMDPETGATGTDTGEDQAQAGQMDSETETGQAGRALSDAGTERIVSDLQQAGIENPAEFQGQIVRARTSDGAPVFFMISSQDMQAGADGIDEDEIRQNLEQADLQDIQFIGDAKLLRGDMEGDQVFVLAGSDLMGSGARQQ